MTDYANIERHLPMVVKVELSGSDEISRVLFADEFGKKKKSIFTAYLFLILLSLHRWYLGKPGMTILQWAVVVVTMGFGSVWIVLDIFRLPKIVREKNEETAKSILGQQRMMRRS